MSLRRRVFADMGYFVLGAMLIIPFVDRYAGSIDGYYRPAAAPMVLTATRYSKGNGWTEFDGGSARLRPECSFAGIEWFRGERDGQHVPAIVQLGKPEVRHNGAFTFTGWAVNVTPPYDFETDTFADALHQCRAFTSLDADGVAVGGFDLPWFTRSQFWR